MTEIKQIQWTTIQRAAEISSLVTRRTIGPDLQMPNTDHHVTKSPDNTTKYSNSSPSTPNSNQLAIKNNEKNAKSPINNNNVTPTTAAAAIPVTKVVTPRTPSLDLKAMETALILSKHETERKRNVLRELIEKHQKQNLQLKENLTLFEQEMSRDRERKLENRLENNQLILNAAAEQSAKEMQCQRKQMEELHRKTALRLQLISCEGILKWQVKFRNKYEKTSSLLLVIDRQGCFPVNEYSKRLRELAQTFDKIIQMAKEGKSGLNELKVAESIFQQLLEVEKSFIRDFDEMQMKRSMEQKQVLQQEPPPPPPPTATPTSETVSNKEKDTNNQVTSLQGNTNGNNQANNNEDVQSCEKMEAISAASLNVMGSQGSSERMEETKSGEMVTMTTTVSYVSPERLEFYSRINKMYLEKVERVKLLQSNESMKKYRCDCQKAINIPVNAISAVNAVHLQDKFDKLFNFISSQSDPLARDYCILLMAKKFVGQGETTISSNPQAAFPVASVIVSLWKLVPEFGEMFLAYVYKECPFLVPYFIPQKEGQSWEDYAKVLGYRFSNGQMETQDMYLKRQCGIARLYAAVLITNGKKQNNNLNAMMPQQQQQQQHPYGIENGWRWLTNFVVLNPIPDICATLVMEMLQIIGHELWVTYGKQFMKLLIYLQQVYFPRLAMVDEGGPKARLELALNTYLRSGRIDKPQGLLTPDFW